MPIGCFTKGHLSSKAGLRSPHTLFSCTFDFQSSQATAEFMGHCIRDGACLLGPTAW